MVDRIFESFNGDLEVRTGDDVQTLTLHLGDVAHQLCVIEHGNQPHCACCGRLWPCPIERDRTFFKAPRA